MLFFWNFYSSDIYKSEMSQFIQNVSQGFMFFNIDFNKKCFWSTKSAY